MSVVAVTGISYIDGEREWVYATLGSTQSESVTAGAGGEGGAGANSGSVNGGNGADGGQGGNGADGGCVGNNIVDNICENAGANP